MHVERRGAVVWAALVTALAGCETPSSAEADHALSRTPQTNPHALKERSQGAVPHAPAARDRVEELLRSRYAERLPGLLSALVVHRTYVDEQDPAHEPRERAAFFRALQAQAAALGLVFREATPRVAEITLDSEPPGAPRELGILAHGDVVPAGDGWTFPAFSGEVRDGKVLGRGTMDDKGPLVAALVAMAVTRDAGAARPFRTRLMVGMAEETTWECMEGYLASHAPPAFTFVIDGSFPVGVGEKGLASIKVAERWAEREPAAGRCAVVRLDGGVAGNVVPDRAEAELRCAGAADAVRARLADERRVQVEAAGAGRLRVRATGKAAHASTPEQGRNALAALMVALDTHAQLDEDAPGTQLVRFLAARVGMELYGEKLGIASEHARFGRTTVNLGRLRHDGAVLVASLNIRFVPGRTPVEVVERVRAAAASWAAERGRPLGLVVDGGGLPALDQDPARPEVTALLSAYTAATGRPARPVTLAGTTYAKAIPNAVSFGPEEDGAAERRHGPDESITTAELFELARIYAAGLTALAALKP